MVNKEYDVIVVGGGPAGSATAIGCASAGMNVLLLE
ncbi:MAG: FAD-dependent oxidoreductase, partial [Candidatus Thorarchaeota archaeon]|nr:FAD-dependent oxidoreductase [Candidatus Thorarchaeota archaeon]